MAERTTAKSKRPDVAKAASTVAAKVTPKGVSKKSRAQADTPSSAGAAASATGLAAENARLSAELVIAHERIADLERRQTEITNRIAWVIDSLHNLAD